MPPPPPPSSTSPVLYPPVITLVNPQGSQDRTTINTYNVRARITYIASKNDVRFNVNGYETNDFSFNPSNGDFSANIRLREGENQIAISAANPSGSDQKTSRILLEVSAPERVDVNIIDPKQNPFTTNQNITSVTAQVSGVTDKRDIQMLVNGRAFTSYTFTPSNGSLSANITLEKGNNNVTIKASNKGYSDTDERTIIYQTNVTPPNNGGNKPVVTIIQPTPGEVMNTKYASVKAKILNVSNKNDLVLTVNGVKLFNFDFTTKDNSF